MQKSLEVDRGHVEAIRALCGALKDGKPSPIDFKSIVATTATTFAVEQSISTGEAIEIDLGKWLRD